MKFIAAALILAVTPRFAAAQTSFGGGGPIGEEATCAQRLYEQEKIADDQSKSVSERKAAIDRVAAAGYGTCDFELEAETKVGRYLLRNKDDHGIDLRRPEWSMDAISQVVKDNGFRDPDPWHNAGFIACHTQGASVQCPPQPPPVDAAAAAANAEVADYALRKHLDLLSKFSGKDGRGRGEVILRQLTRLRVDYSYGGRNLPLERTLSERVKAIIASESANPKRSEEALAAYQKFESEEAAWLSRTELAAESLHSQQRQQTAQQTARSLERSQRALTAISASLGQQ
ncbi:MAG: hypothetical protein ACHQ2Z_02235 [Elusimicrobiota bacterium]